MQMLDNLHVYIQLTKIVPFLGYYSQNYITIPIGKHKLC